MKRPKRAETRELVDATLSRLAGPLTPEDRASGWDDESRALVAEVINEIRSRLADPRPLEAREVRLSLSRDLNDVGVLGGSLAGAIARISLRLNAHVQWGQLRRDCLNTGRRTGQVVPE